MRKKEKVIRDFFRDNPDFLDALENKQFGNPEQWLDDNEFDEVISKRLYDIGTKAIQAVEARRKRIRKSAISVTACAAIFVVTLISVTSPGQAWAKSVYRSVAQLFNGSLFIQHSDTALKENDSQLNSVLKFTTIQETTKYIKHSLVFVDDKGVKINEISVQEQEGLIIVLTNYSFKNQNFSLQQCIYKDSTLRSTFVPTEKEEYKEIKLANNKTIYWTHTPEGNFVGIVDWDDTQIQIVSDNIDDIDLRSIIENIKVYEK